MTAPATVPAPSRAVALAPTAPGQIQSASEMVQALEAVKAAIAPDLNPAELKLFAMVAYRSGLDPFARQIHAVKRQGKVTFQTGIDGFRSSAERTGEYDGSDEPEFGPNCSCTENPKPHPEWARVTVYRLRDGIRKGQSATAYWHEFKPAPGSSGNGDAMWKKMPRNQLAKCAEALAFRKAFPYVLADVYTNDEMAQAAGPVVVEHRATAREAVAARRAEVEARDDAGEGEGAAAATDDQVEVVAGEIVDEDAAWRDDEDASDGGEEEFPRTLTREAFNQLKADAGIETKVVREAAARLFPEAKGMGDLGDEDRAILWAELNAQPGAAA